MALNDLIALLSGENKQEVKPVEQDASSLKQIAKDVEYKNRAKLEIAKVLAAEGASEGEKGMVAIANTIANRAKSRGKTPLDIVTAKNQYYGYTAPNKEKLYAQVKERADRIANDLVEGRLEDTTNGAEYFLLPNEKVRTWHGEKTIK